MFDTAQRQLHWSRYGEFRNERQLSQSYCWFSQSAWRTFMPSAIVIDSRIRVATSLLTAVLALLGMINLPVG